MSASASDTPIIGIDYSFITECGVNTRTELMSDPVFTAEEAIDEARQNGQVAKCILVRDHAWFKGDIRSCSLATYPMEKAMWQTPSLMVCHG